MSPALATVVFVALGILLAVCVVLLIALSALWVDAHLRDGRQARRAQQYRDLHGSDAVDSWLEAIDWERLRPTNGERWHDGQEGDPV